MTNLELVAKANEVYAEKERWTYVQGGLGELADSARIKGLYTYYRGKGNGSTCDYPEWLEKYGKINGHGKKCTDCSNFIQVLLGSGKNAAASHYTNMKDAGNIFVAPVGTILLIPNAHVGIVTKQGIRNADGTFKVEPEVMDFYAYNNTCRKMSYVNKGFTKAVYLTGIDYVTSPSTDTHPVKVEATVIGTHFIGEILQASDFIVKVTMNNGTVLTNPANWYATPLKLTAKNNAITVGYQDVSTVVNVPAIGSAPTPVGLTATIDTEHILGDTLQASDFTIRVAMSDGTVITNPSNWAASPLKLTADTTQIKVQYGNLVTYIPVRYKALFG